MLPGPDNIVACPHCGQPASIYTVRSYSRWGGRAWTDGFVEYEGYQPDSPVAKCPACGQCFWRNLARSIGSRPAMRDPASPWADVPSVQVPDAADHIAAVDRGLAQTRELQRTLRVLAWWLYNTPIRRQVTGIVTLPDGELLDLELPRKTPIPEGADRENLLQLLILLEPGHEEDSMMTAELLRELGDFPGAVWALHRVTSPRFDARVLQLRELCAAEDAWVRPCPIARRGDGKDPPKAAEH